MQRGAESNTHGYQVGGFYEAPGFQLLHGGLRRLVGPGAFNGKRALLQEWRLTQKTWFSQIESNLGTNQSFGGGSFTYPLDFCEVIAH